MVSGLASQATAGRTNSLSEESSATSRQKPSRDPVGGLRGQSCDQPGPTMLSPEVIPERAEASETPR